MLLAPKEGGEDDEQGLFCKEVVFFFMEELAVLLWKRVLATVQSLVLTMEGVSSNNGHRLVLMAVSMKMRGFRLEGWSWMVMLGCPR